MEFLTLLFFLLSLGVFIVAAFRRPMAIRLMTLALSIIALATILTDETITDDLGLTCLIVLQFVEIIMSVMWTIFPSREEGRGLRWRGDQPLTC